MNVLRMKLPGTSANLGPGFDAVGLAMTMWLEVEAEVAEKFSIRAEGRDREQVERLESNLMLETYKAVAGVGPALRLRIRNGIPLGMGCGSSAAALCAGVLLANYFGQLGMTDAAVLAEACRREGHPDNVAACLLGGFTCSSMRGGRVTTATFGVDLPWRLVLVIPEGSLATEKARALLPGEYARAAVVENIQATALLMAAFAQGRPELLLEGTRDRVHQPYRAEACGLLTLLLPLAGQGGIYSVTLSGAGPAVLLICNPTFVLSTLTRQVYENIGTERVEVLELGIAGAATCDSQYG